MSRALCQNSGICRKIGSIWQWCLFFILLVSWCCAFTSFGFWQNFSNGVYDFILLLGQFFCFSFSLKVVFIGNLSLVLILCCLPIYILLLWLVRDWSWSLKRFCRLSCADRYILLIRQRLLDGLDESRIQGSGKDLVGIFTWQNNTISNTNPSSFLATRWWTFTPFSPISKLQVCIFYKLIITN